MPAPNEQLRAARGHARGALRAKQVEGKATLLHRIQSIYIAAP